MNLHAYVGNAPTHLVDPTGEVALLALPVAGCVGGALGAALGQALHGRKASGRELVAGCAAGALVGIWGWALAPALGFGPAVGLGGAGVAAARGEDVR